MADSFKQTLPKKSAMIHLTHVMHYLILIIIADPFKHTLPKYAVIHFTYVRCII